MKLCGWILTAAMTLGGLCALAAGCRDNTPPPPNVPVPTADNPDAIRTRDPMRPLPPQASPQQSEQRKVN